MKKRSFIPIASLVVLSGVAAVSGTFAWFQTNRSLNLTFNDATVKSRDSSLVVEYGGSLNSKMEATVGAAVQGELNLALTAKDGGQAIDQFVTDISGNGDKFYKIEQGYRINDNTDKEDGVSWQIPLAINDVTPSSIGDADGYLIDFTIKLSRTELTTGAGRPLEVYLGSGTKIEPAIAQNVNDEQAVKGARLSVNASSYAAPKLFTQVAEEDTVSRFKGFDANGQPEYEAGFDNSNPLYMYLEEGEVGTDEAYKFEGFKLTEATPMTVLSSITDETTNNTGAATYLTTITDAGVAKAVELNFRMWIEGTDADVGFSDNNIAVNGKIKLTLDLYTLHVGPQI